MLLPALFASAEFRWGPTAGFNYSDLSFKQDLIDDSGRCGFQAGVLGEVMIPGIGFGIDFGLRYAMEGGKADFGQREVWASTGFGNENVVLHTLELPIDLRFKYTRFGGLEKIIAPFAFAGPVFRFNVAHNELKGTDGKNLLQYPWGSVGVQAGLGAELIEHLQVSVSYCWGLTYQIRTVKLDNFSARDSNWMVNVAWLF